MERIVVQFQQLIRLSANLAQCFWSWALKNFAERKLQKPWFVLSRCLSIWNLGGGIVCAFQYSDAVPKVGRVGVHSWWKNIARKEHGGQTRRHRQALVCIVLSIPHTPPALYFLITTKLHLGYEKCRSRGLRISFEHSRLCNVHWHCRTDGCYCISHPPTGLNPLTWCSTAERLRHWVTAVDIF